MQPRTVEQNVQQVTGPAFGFLEAIPAQVYWLLAVGSVFASAYLFLTGRRAWALFVGQWPPTFLALTLFFKLLRPSMEQPVREMREAAQEARRIA